MNNDGTLFDAWTLYEIWAKEQWIQIEEKMSLQLAALKSI